MRTLFFIVLLAGCTNWPSVADSWSGHHINDLIFAWGPPTSSAALPDGRQIMIWDHEHTRLTGSRQCSVKVRTDNGGVVRFSEVNGGFSGCNRLFDDKPPAD